MDFEVVFDFPDLGDGYNAFVHDQGLWKIPNFIKIVSEQIEINSWLQKNYV